MKVDEDEGKVEVKAEVKAEAVQEVILVAEVVVELEVAVEAQAVAVEVVAQDIEGLRAVDFPLVDQVEDVVLRVVAAAVQAVAVEAQDMEDLQVEVDSLLAAVVHLAHLEADFPPVARQEVAPTMVVDTKALSSLLTHQKEALTLTLIISHLLTIYFHLSASSFFFQTFFINILYTLTKTSKNHNNNAK